MLLLKIRGPGQAALCRPLLLYRNLAPLDVVLRKQQNEINNKFLGKKL